MKIKPIHGVISLIAALSIIFTFTACSSDTNSQTTPSASSNPDAETSGSTVQTTPTEPTGKTIKIECGTKSASGEGSVELNASRSFTAGKTITVTLPEGEHYLAFNLCKNVMQEAILYVPDGVFTYTIPNLTFSYPTNIATRPVITARIPEASELTASHNLALNPADLIDPKMRINGYSYDAFWDGKVFPHVTTSSVCRYASDQTSKYQFEARNAIDGFTQNNGHGNYPVQSWGPDSDFNTRTGYITVDFGHDVKVDTLNLYIRADFPHDTYFTSAEIVFSDGSTQSVELTNSAKVQTFDLGGKTTSSVKLTKLSKADANGWVGLMEIEVMGSEIAG